MKEVVAICLLMCLCAFGVHGGQFPGSVSFTLDGQEVKLQKTGTAVRKKLFIDVYHVAHYLEGGLRGSDKIAEVMAPGRAKQLTLRWSRDVPAENVQEGFHESFHKSLSSLKYATLQDTIERFLTFFPKGAHKGEEFQFRWLSTGSVDVLIQGKQVGTITKKGFATGLWQIWFGPNSVVKRESLVSGS